MLNVNSTLNQLNNWMSSIEGGHQKTAGDSVETEDKNDGSYKDSGKAAPDKATSFEAVPNQTNLGKEQSSAAMYAGNNIEEQPVNNDSLGKKPTDDQGTNTMNSDESVITNGNIGPVKKEQINTAQKEAHADRMANNILNTIQGRLAKQHEKEAYSEDTATDGVSKSDGTMASPSAEVVDKGDGANPAMCSDCKEAPCKCGGDKEASAKPQLSEMAKEAGDRYAHFYEKGLQKRAMDEAALTEAAPEQVAAAGGAESVLDEVAASDPESVLPAEMAEGGAPVVDPEADAIFQELEAAGVTDEDLVEAVQVMSEMEQAGVKPEELQQALLETTSEMEGLPVEKTAASLGMNPVRINVIKSKLYEVFS